MIAHECAKVLVSQSGIVLHFSGKIAYGIIHHAQFIDNVLHLFGQRVALTYDIERHDIYGRTLAFVALDGQRYNDELLRLGYARLLVIPPNGAHARAMLREVVDARNARRGLWGACE